MFRRKKKSASKPLTDCEKRDIKRQKAEAFDQIKKAKEALDAAIDAEMPFTSFTTFIGKRNDV